MADENYTPDELAWRCTQAKLEEAIDLRRAQEKKTAKHEKRYRKTEEQKRRRHKIAIEALADVAEGGGDLSRVEAAKRLLET
jgi:hypothetical protein